MRFILPTMAALALAAIPTLAHASTIAGDTVAASYQANLGSGNVVLSDFGTFTVPGGGSAAVELAMNYQLTPTQLILTEHAGKSTPLANLSFSGFVFTDQTGNFDFNGPLTLDAASTGVGFSASELSVSGNVLSLNLAGHSLGTTYTMIDGSLVATGQTVIFDLGTPAAATPEPSSLVLLGTGALGLAGSLRRRLAAR